MVSFVSFVSFVSKLFLRFGINESRIDH
jgi:hypothetical protein